VVPVTALARTRQLLPRLGRLGVFLLAVSVGLQWLGGRVAGAEVDRALLDLGSGLARLATPGDGPRVLELNGMRLSFATEAIEESVDAILDEAVAACDGASEPGLAGRFLRGEERGRGFVACTARLAAGEAGELGATGYRYVYAQPGDERTQVVRFWTDRPLDLEALFPASGDAPGRDAAGLPRPPGARRILSAREVGAPQEMTLYADPPGATDELVAWYRERLPGLGWQALASPPPEPGERVLVVGRAGSLAALVFADEPGAGRSVAILTSL
jgi:hypothetical protein